MQGSMGICGIGGILFSSEEKNAGQLDSVLNALQGRGSSESDRWDSGIASLCMTGGKIWKSADSSVLILFDGYLTDISDPCKHIYELYIKENDRAFQKLEGAFSVAIYNTLDNELLLARDKFGKKPLYWTYQKGHFLFGSELKSLLRTNLFTKSLDHEGIAEYFSFGYLPLEKTLIHRVYKLFPGHFVRFTKAREYFIRPYFTLASAIKKKDPSWNSDAYRDLPTESPASLMMPQDGDIDSLEDFVWKLDEPIADLNAFLHYLSYEKGEPCSLHCSPSYLASNLYTPKIPGLGLLSFRKPSVHSLHLAYVCENQVASKNVLLECPRYIPETFLHRFPTLDKLGPTLNSLLYLFVKTTLPHKELAYREKILSRENREMSLPYLEDKLFTYTLSIPEKNLRSLSKKPKKSTPPFLNMPSLESRLQELSRGFCVQSDLIGEVRMISLCKSRRSPSSFASLWAILIFEIWIKQYFEN